MISFTYRTNVAWDSIETNLTLAACNHGATVQITNSNHEGELVDILLNSSSDTSIILNSGGMYIL